MSVAKARPIEGDAPPPSCFEQPRGVSGYFALLLTSVVFRAFEAGIMSSLLSNIADELNLSYFQQGVIAASPDFGIVPSGLIAIYVFQHFDAYSVLVVCQGCLFFLAMLVVVFPAFGTIVAARSLGGLCWGFCAVYFPAWINAHTSKQRAAIWLGGYNAMLLIGILLGYALGAAAATYDFASWTQLYFVEGVLMGLCSIATVAFPPALLQVVTLPPYAAGVRWSLLGAEQRLRATPLLDSDALGDVTGSAAAAPPPPPEPVLVILKKLLVSPLYVWTVLTGAMQAGTVCFTLYFVDEACDAMDFWSTSMTYVVIVTMFLITVIPGALAGGHYTARLGGYVNTASSLQFAAQAFAGAALGTVIAVVGVMLTSPAIFLLGIWEMLFAGALPAAALNGVCVAALPSATHAGSGVQFAFQNAGKLLLPLAGGVLIDVVGDITAGFLAMLVVGGLLMLGCASMAYSYASADRAATAQAAVDGSAALA